MANNEVIVNAYPKSGVTWLLHLVCDLLEGVHKDKPEAEPLSYNHPVTSNWIIRKGHYPYWSAAIPYLDGQNIVLTQRDPRDIVVSAMYYRKTTDLDAAINQLIKSSYIDWVESWIKPKEPLRVNKLIVTSYERLQFYPVDSLREIILNLTGQRLSDDRINEAIDRQSFDSMIDQLGGDRHFMRKGIVGDWRNHFTREQGKYFAIHFNNFMLEQGYIADRQWWLDVKK